MRAPDAVQLTRELLGYNTINPPGAEEGCARHLGDLLAGGGFKVDCAAFAPGRVSVVARIGGNDRKPPLGFTGHIDTVPLGSAAWQQDAFGASQEGGKIYGRGSTDMKSGVAAFVVAALARKEVLARGPGATLAITADEECGCGGAAHLVERQLLGPVGALVVSEPTANYPLIGHKGALWLKAIAHGVTAHGSMPERGDNAIHKAAEAVAKLARFEFGVAAHPLMGAPTLNIGTIEGGMNINSVPDRAAIGIDMRTIPGQDHAAVRTELARLLGPAFSFETMIDVGPVSTDATDPWVQRVYDTMTPLLGARPEARTVTYFTDAAVLKRVWRDVPVVVLGPGEPQLAHQTDEYCLVDRIGQAAEAYTRLIDDWCGQ